MTRDTNEQGASGEDSPQLVCTLTPEEGRRRRSNVDTLVERVVARERLDDGLRVRFASGDDTAQRVETFVRNESDCCSFADYAVDADGDGVVLRITVPSEAAWMIDGVLAVFDPEATDEDRIATVGGLMESPDVWDPGDVDDRRQAAEQILRGDGTRPTRSPST